MHEGKKSITVIHLSSQANREREEEEEEERLLYLEGKGSTRCPQGMQIAFVQFGSTYQHISPSLPPFPLSPSKLQAKNTQLVPFHIKGKLIMLIALATRFVTMKRQLNLKANYVQCYV